MNLRKVDFYYYKTQIDMSSFLPCFLFIINDISAIKQSFQLLIKFLIESQQTDDATDKVLGIYRFRFDP